MIDGVLDRVCQRNRSEDVAMKGQIYIGIESVLASCKKTVLSLSSSVFLCRSLQYCILCADLYNDFVLTTLFDRFMKSEMGNLAGST